MDLIKPGKWRRFLTHGKRPSGDKKHVTLSIDRELLGYFRATCQDHDIPMSAVVEGFITEFLQEMVAEVEHEPIPDPNAIKRMLKRRGLRPVGPK